MDPPSLTFDHATAPHDRPLLLVDVDGVLNVCNKSADTTVYDIFDAMGYKIRFRKELPEWMAELESHFTLVWCTTWDYTANECFSEHLGLPYLPVIPTREAAGHPHAPLHWKTPAVEAYVGDRPYAWIDDDFGRYDDIAAANRTDAGIPTRVVTTRIMQGIRRHHVDVLLKWSQSL